MSRRIPRNKNKLYEAAQVNQQLEHLEDLLDRAIDYAESSGFDSIADQLYDVIRSKAFSSYK